MLNESVNILWREEKIGKRAIERYHWRNTFPSSMNHYETDGNSIKNGKQIDNKTKPGFELQASNGTTSALRPHTNHEKHSETENNSNTFIILSFPPQINQFILIKKQNICKKNQNKLNELVTKTLLIQFKYGSFAKSVIKTVSQITRYNKLTVNLLN